LVWVQLAAAIKRLHDLDISGWWSISVLLIPMLPIIILGAFADRPAKTNMARRIIPSDEDVAGNHTPDP
jgi:uncharacterized membrane protein YhaH (DUF805 family)